MPVASRKYLRVVVRVLVHNRFTGLPAAMSLADGHGIKAMVLGARQAIQGCTSRDGGHGQSASERLYPLQRIQRRVPDISETV